MNVPRQEEEAWIYGIHAVASVLERRRLELEGLWISGDSRNPRLEALAEQARRQGVPVHLRPAEWFEERLPGTRHQGVVARARPVPVGGESELLALVEALEVPPFLLVLDGVQDPHNLGACLRTADGAGIHAVVTPRDRAAGITPTVRKVASGAAESVPLFQVTNLARSLGRLQEAGVWLVGMDGDAPRTLYEQDLSGPLALVLGAEGRGLRRLTRERCDHLVRLPMFGSVSSLNVSVAAGIAMYEALRQRMG